MRRNRLRKTLFWLAPGGVLWLSCPSGTAQFLAPIIQPILSQVLSDVATSLTDDLLNPSDQP